MKITFNKWLEVFADGQKVGKIYDNSAKKEVYSLIFLNAKGKKAWDFFEISGPADRKDNAIEEMKEQIEIFAREVRTVKKFIKYTAEYGG